MRLSGITILIGIFCLCYSQVAPCAEIKVVDNNVVVETDTYQVQRSSGRKMYANAKCSEWTGQRKYRTKKD